MIELPDGRLWYIQRSTSDTLENTCVYGPNFVKDGVPYVDDNNYPGMLIFSANDSNADFTDTNTYK
jgi:hypothetical protein